MRMRELTGDKKIRLSQIKGLKEWRERLALDKEDANGMEHSDKSGRFVSKNGGNNGGKKRKGPLKVVSKSELHDFIEKYKTDKTHDRVSLGAVSEDAKNRIKKATGIDVERAILDSDSVFHAYSKANHNLDPDDLDDMKEIIDTTTDIQLSPEKTKQGLPVIIFKQQKPNGVILCEEFRAGKKELELQTAYRVKKNRQPRSAGKSQPLAYVRNVVAPTNNIQQQSPKVKKNQTKDSLLGIWARLKGGEP